MNTRCGFVALIGAPNAGKSTLMNQLVGTKISIVTHKVQTTRAVMRGVAMRDNAQIVFIDTPGIFNPRRKLDEAMVTTAWGSARDADISVCLIDVERGLTEDIEALIAKMGGINGKRVLLLNKIDQVPRDKLLALTLKINEIHAFDETFMVSALNGDGCEDFLNYLASNIPEGPYMYPEDQISDLPLRMLAAEVTREKIYLRLHQELPYSSHVETEGWEEKKDGSVKISQVIYVERDSQKKIIIGKNGKVTDTFASITKPSSKRFIDLIEEEIKN